MHYLEFGYNPKVKTFRVMKNSAEISVALFVIIKSMVIREFSRHEFGHSDE